MTPELIAIIAVGVAVVGQAWRQNNALKREMNERFDKLDERFDRLDERFDKLIGRFKNLEGRMTQDGGEATGKLRGSAGSRNLQPVRLMTPELIAIIAAAVVLAGLILNQ